MRGMSPRLDAWPSSRISSDDWSLVTTKREDTPDPLAESPPVRTARARQEYLRRPYGVESQPHTRRMDMELLIPFALTRVSVGLLAIAALWAFAVISSESRNWRFLSFLGIASVLAIGGLATSGLIGRLVELVVLGVATAAFYRPARFGLSSVTPVDREAHVVLDSLSRALDHGADSRELLRLREALESEPFASPSGPWAEVGRLFSMVVARSLEHETVIRKPGRTPIWAYRQAGRDYWAAALERRVLGRHGSPTAWDEDVLLRAYSESLDRIIPAGAVADKPLPRERGWDEDARRLVDEVRCKHLRHPISAAMQHLLVDAMDAHIALAIGDRTRATIDRGNAAAAALTREWPALAEAAHRASSGSR